VADQEWRERVIGALGAVIAVALVIGAIVGVATYSAVHVAGLDDAEPQARSSPTAGNSSSADNAAATSPETSAAPSSSPHPAQPTKTAKPQEHSRASHHRPHHRKHHRDRHSGSLTLAASPGHTRPMGRINLFGRYPGHSGSGLAVQRMEGGHWGSFPVSVTVRHGRFHTWVASGRNGPNQFRVVDTGAGRASAAVTVVVG
jgi:hypothetical protein